MPGRPDPIVLPRDSAGLQLLQRIRDEAHRFALGFHRQRRETRARGSIFDDLQGIGPVRRRALLQHFGSAERLLEATEAELEGVPGVPAKTARADLRAAPQGRQGMTCASARRSSARRGAAAAELRSRALGRWVCRTRRSGRRGARAAGRARGASGSLDARRALATVETQCGCGRRPATSGRSEAIGHDRRVRRRRSTAAATPSLSWGRCFRRTRRSVVGPRRSTRDVVPSSPPRVEPRGGGDRLSRHSPCPEVRRDPPARPPIDRNSGVRVPTGFAPPALRAREPRSP